MSTVSTTISVYVGPCCLLSISDALKTHVEIIGTRICLSNIVEGFPLQNTNLCLMLREDDSNSKQSIKEIKWKE